MYKQPKVAFDSIFPGENTPNIAGSGKMLAFFLQTAEAANKLPKIHDGGWMKMNENWQIDCFSTLYVLCMYNIFKTRAESHTVSPEHIASRRAVSNFLRPGKKSWNWKLYCCVDVLSLTISVCRHETRFRFETKRQFEIWSFLWIETEKRKKPVRKTQ